ncbi:hypothetical protein [Nocardia farcinica]
MPAETCTYDLDHVVQRTGVPSVDWLRRKLNAGLVPGRRAGRTWRMTESDIAALVDYIARPARRQSVADAPAPVGIAALPASVKASALTSGSRRKLHRHTA